MTWQRTTLISLHPNFFSALSDLGLLCYDQLCFDKVFLMKGCVLLSFANNIFPDLNPRVNILLAGEIFTLHLVSKTSWFYMSLLGQSIKAKT